ncbi:MAG: hypothetical protein ACPLZY_04785, partial [Candidatus Norongarragalinales archaeon]
MKKQYITNKETNIEELTQNIANFLRQIDLKAEVKKFTTGYEISAYSTTNARSRIACITIDGKPNNFTIEIRSENEKPKFRNMWLMQMFGAGAILVRQWHTEDLW